MKGYKRYGRLRHHRVADIKAIIRSEGEDTYISKRLNHAMLTMIRATTQEEDDGAVKSIQQRGA